MNIGSIRRIDELGRIVIPKNIRQELKIRPEDNLKIYIKEDKIVIEKYSEMSREIEIEKAIAKTIKEIIKAEVIVTDKERVIIGESKLKKELPEKITSIISAFPEFSFNAFAQAGIAVETTLFGKME